MQILGVMSGSSLDGLDMATVEFSIANGLRWSLADHKTYAIPNELKQGLGKALELNCRDLAELEYRYSSYIASRILEFKHEFGDNFDICSIHGHTLVHNIELGYSWQLLNGGLVSGMTDKHIVSDFRNQDMAKGGIGTPMAAVIDRDLFSGHRYYINLGGIANITESTEVHTLAYDLAPCNQVHNYLAQKLGSDYDEGGRIAASSHFDEDLLNKLLELSKSKGIPRAIDNSWIHDSWIPMLESWDLEIPVLLSTHYKFLAELIAGICTDPGSSVLLTGGGAKNDFFLDVLRRELNEDVSLVIPEDTIVDFKESILMAYLAFKRFRQEPNFIHECTGASQSVCAGAVYLSNTKS